MSSSHSRRTGWALFLFTLCASWGGWAATRLVPFDEPYVWWAGGTLLVLCAFPSVSLFVELGLFPLLYAAVLSFAPDVGTSLSFPFVVSALALLAHPLASRGASALVVVGALPWADLPAFVRAPGPTWPVWTLVAFGLLGLALVIAGSARQRSAPKRIDLLLCSYSGNTAHYTQAFTQAARDAGVEVTVHRFHHHLDFRASFTGDALVVAYPIAGWNPFWPMLEFLLFRLPKANGKPAFILYTSAGGPENGHVVPWIALWARGYRVLGRLGAMYPMNVTLFRLFSSRMWRLFDALLPRPSDTRLCERVGAAFAAGRPDGFGLTLFPFVLFVLGPLTYNRFVNYIYRGYSYKSLCNQCGRCIRFCPTERLYLKNGRVRSKGTCALCYGCVNLCPTDAMQLALVSEIGNVYTPRWPKLVVRRKPKPERRRAEAPTDVDTSDEARPHADPSA